MRAVTLQEVLDAREERAAAQRRMLEESRRPLLSLTMNIPGPVKRSALSDFAFREAARDVRQRLAGKLLRERLTDAPAGLEAIWACDLPAEELKNLAMELESTPPAGRLLDLDVIGTDGGKLSRGIPRTCLVCGRPAPPCARSRAHGLPAIQAAVRTLLEAFAAGRLAELAVEALVREVDLTPKPGLVDRRTNGAHRDMSPGLFYRSARALAPYFRRAVELGLESPGCMPSLRQAGLAAEGAMFAATGGVNTHKGAVYAFGLALAGLGSVLARGGDLFQTAAALAASGPPPALDTHGGRAALLYGAAGARGEALSGFPHARRAWEALPEKGPFAALLTLLAEVEDTNLLHRGGREGLRFVQEQASGILAGAPEEYASRLETLDRACTERNLSPGGSADLLALAFLLERTEGVWRGGGQPENFEREPNSHLT